MADDAPMLEQIAQRFELYASDNEAFARRRGMSSQSVIDMRYAIKHWRDAAKEIRDLVTAQNKAEYQVAINKVLDDFGTSQVLRDDVSLAIVEIFFGKVKADGV